MADAAAGESQDGDRSGAETGRTRALQANEYYDDTGRIRRRPSERAASGESRGPGRPRKGESANSGSAAAGDGFGTNPDHAEQSSARATVVPQPPPVTTRSRLKLTDKRARALLTRLFNGLSLRLGPHWKLSDDERDELATTLVETQDLAPPAVVDVANRWMAPIYLLIAFAGILGPRMLITSIQAQQAQAQRQAAARTAAADAAMRGAGFGGVRYDNLGGAAPGPAPGPTSSTPPVPPPPPWANGAAQQPTQPGLVQTPDGRIIAQL